MPSLQSFLFQHLVWAEFPVKGSGVLTWFNQQLLPHLPAVGRSDAQEIVDPYAECKRHLMLEALWRNTLMEILNGQMLQSDRNKTDWAGSWRHHILSLEFWYITAGRTTIGNVHMLTMFFFVWPNGRRHPKSMWKRDDRHLRPLLWRISLSSFSRIQMVGLNSESIWIHMFFLDSR